MAAALKRRLKRALPVLGVFLLLLASLWFMSDATQHSARFERLYLWVLLVNAVVLIVLTLLIAPNLIDTAARAYRREPGSRLTLRLTTLFIILSLAPVSVVYYFSITFLHRGIDSWFDVRVETALADALDLSKSALDIRVRQLLTSTGAIAEGLENVPDGLAALAINDLLRDSDASGLTLFGANNRIIATGGGGTGTMVPPLPTEEITLRLAQGQPWHALEPTPDAGLDIRILIPIPATPTRPEPRALQALYPVTPRLAQLAENVQDAFSEYKEFAYLREPLKQSFSITLSLVLMLSVFAAIWAAFRSSRQFMAPIRELADGTRAVAEGRYHTRLSEGGTDDLGYLLRSFNEMTAALAAARDEAERSRRLAESRSAFVEAVLQHLSSGVITLDAEGRLCAANDTAAAILEANLQPAMNRPLADLAAEHETIGGFHEEIAPWLRKPEREWQTQAVVFGSSGRKVLIVRGARLSEDSSLPGGCVLVIDDITALIQAQRDAAWGEVARRLAHEIKNPLTPIQLSAERLAHKLQSRLDEDGARLLNRATQTIIQQVEAMKTMVNAFSEYARPPTVKFEQIDLNPLIRDVAELYRADPRHRRMILDLDDTIPSIEADAGRLRQLLHNLVKNALEATEGLDEGCIEIRTRTVETVPGHPAARQEDLPWGGIRLSICDNGPGFDPALVDRIFDPYVTSKPKGTGLGLAVVRKIVEEHGGIIRAENRTGGGACLTIQFLAIHAERAA